MKLETHEDVTLITMDAGKANAINPAFIDALDQLLEEARRQDADTLVITGHGKFFSAGLDLPRLCEFDRDGMRETISRFDDVMMSVLTWPAPVVAAVNGHAIAGGCVLAMQADERVMAADGATTGLNEATLGVGLPPTALEVMRHRLPTSSLLTVGLKGDLLNGQDALALGLVESLAPTADVLPRAMDRASELASVPTNAYAQIKRELLNPVIIAINEGRDRSVEEWLDNWFCEETQGIIRAAVTRLTARRDS